MNDLLDLPDLPDLRDLIARATADLEAPTGLEAFARRRGHAIRVRRRALTAGVGVAAAAAVAAIAVPLTAGDDTAGPVATQPMSAGTATASATPFVAKPGWWDRPAPSMEKVLAGLLPQGVKVASFQTTVGPNDLAPGEDPHLTGELTGVLDGPTGPGAFEIQLIQLPDGDWARANKDAAAHVASLASTGMTNPPFAFAEPGDGSVSPLAQVVLSDFTCDGATPTYGPCEVRLDSPVGDVRERTNEVDGGDVTTREVRIHASSGELYVAVANATDRKWQGPATASQPPLTMQQLTAIAEAAAWTGWVSTSTR